MKRRNKRALLIEKKNSGQMNETSSCGWLKEPLGLALKRLNVSLREYRENPTDIQVPR